MSTQPQPIDRDNTNTARFFAEAGVQPGMRVLEIGCGSGEVTALLARRVGPAGSVVAVDSNEAALAAARERLGAAGHGTVQFVAADAAAGLAALAPWAGQPFDVLAGRRVLMYLRRPAEVLRRLCEGLRPGGLVVFEEADASFTPGRTAPLPAHDRAVGWLGRMLAAEGADPAMGLNLPATLMAAGLRFEKIRGEAVIEGQGAQYPLAHMLALMAPRLAAAGIATPQELDALAAQLREEAGEPGRVYVSGMSFCAWARKP